MVEIDIQSRILIEKIIDQAIKTPEASYDLFSEHLASMGIEPNLETALSYITGYVLGAVAGISVSDKLEGDALRTYMESVRELLERRAWELREAFSRAKYK